MQTRSLFAIAAIALSTPLAVSAQPESGTAPAPAAAAPVAPPAAAVPPSPQLAPAGDISATLAASPHFTILARAVKAAQLDRVLAQTPNITLFAPTDDAFNALPPAQLAALMNPDNANVLQKILIYHLVNTRVDSAKIKGAKGPIPSVETSPLTLDGSTEPLKVNDADIIQADVRATNGLIQVVDKVLIPRDVALPAATAQGGSASPAG